MKKKTKALICVLLGLLSAGSITGAVLTGIQYKKSYAIVNKTDFIDLAFQSLDRAYDELDRCNTYEKFFHLLLILSIAFVVVLIGFLVISWIVERMKGKKNVTLYTADPSDQLAMQGVPQMQPLQQGVPQMQPLQQDIPMGQPQMEMMQQGMPTAQPSATMAQGIPNAPVNEVPGASQVAASLNQDNQVK